MMSRSQKLVATLVAVLALAWTPFLVGADSKRAKDMTLGTVYFGTGEIARDEALAGLPVMYTTMGEVVNINLNLTLMAQNDPAWATIEMNGTCTPPSTIGAEGCALTSTCMVFTYLGNYKTPPQMNTCQGVYACPFGFDTAAMPNYCDPLNKIVWKGYMALDYFVMVSYLNSRYPPVVFYDRPGDVDHFCVVKQVAGDWQLPQSYFIADPNDGVVRTFQYYPNPTTLFLYQKQPQ